ncbi:hypothetical protein [Azospirillum largimobile]
MIGRSSIPKFLVRLPLPPAIGLLREEIVATNNLCIPRYTVWSLSTKMADE